MANILITHALDKHWYTPIASIKLYNEPDFEDKLFRYSEDIFEHYYVFKFKYELQCRALPGKNYEADLLLVSKSFTKWVIVEVELCKAPTPHTINQITCFSKPIIKPLEIVKFLLNQRPELAHYKSQLETLISDELPDFIVVLDDYSDKVFQKFYAVKKQLKICVMEVYKKENYTYEGYRFGGDYPYELTNTSKLEYVDKQHYKVQRKDFIKELPTDDFEIIFDMVPLPASVIKSNRNTTLLKIPNHNIPSDLYLQIGKNLAGEFVIQKL